MERALGYGLFFVLAFAAFGLLAGAFASLPVALIFGESAGHIAAFAIAAIVAHRITLAALATL